MNANEHSDLHFAGVLSGIFGQAFMVFSVYRETGVEESEGPAVADGVKEAQEAMKMLFADDDLDLVASGHTEFFLARETSWFREFVLAYPGEDSGVLLASHALTWAVGVLYAGRGLAPDEVEPILDFLSIVQNVTESYCLEFGENLDSQAEELFREAHDESDKVKVLRPGPGHFPEESILYYSYVSDVKRKFYLIDPLEQGRLLLATKVPIRVAGACHHLTLANLLAMELFTHEELVEIVPGDTCIEVTLASPEPEVWDDFIEACLAMINGLFGRHLFLLMPDSTICKMEAAAETEED